MTAHLRDIDITHGLPAGAEYFSAPEVPGFYARVLKRPLDVFLVLLSAPVTVPLLLILMLLISLDGHSPIYRQRRLGRGGRAYWMLKLRTMAPDADRLLDRLLATSPDARAEWTSLQKLSCDPRITPLGRILRRSSIDELPQLWNVLVGDMSLVGPRPMMVEQRALYPGRAYFEMRPGVSGPWQVSDRNRSTFAERATFDEAYHLDLGFLTDIRILLKTLAVVVRCTGW